MGLCASRANRSFNTQPPEGGWGSVMGYSVYVQVSTHSRLKAAGMASPSFSTSPIGFNTQPPEGGWPRAFKDNIYFSDVSTHSRLKAAGEQILNTSSVIWVSTHSRLKAAGPRLVLYFSLNCGFNTQPPEGGWTLSYKTVAQAVVSTHSRLKAAGTVKRHVLGIGCVSTHSRLKAAGDKSKNYSLRYCVSTHSRLKAAGR